MYLGKEKREDQGRARKNLKNTPGGERRLGKNSQATAQKERMEVNFPAGSGTGACYFPIVCNRQFQQRQESQAAR